MLIISSLSAAIIAVTLPMLIEDSTNPLKPTGESCNEHLKMPEIPKAWGQGGSDWAEESSATLTHLPSSCSSLWLLLC